MQEVNRAQHLQGTGPGVGCKHGDLLMGRGLEHKRLMPSHNQAAASPPMAQGRDEWRLSAPRCPRALTTTVQVACTVQPSSWSAAQRESPMGGQFWRLVEEQWDGMGELGVAGVC